MTTRTPAVAGLFYPGDATSLRTSVRTYLADAGHSAGKTTGVCPKAIIVPHAGYVYSGAIAASAYALLQPCADVIRRVVLLGPSHRVPVRGLALPEVDSFATPLGDIPVDANAVAAITELTQVQPLAAAHAAEHSLEVHLPFLQSVLSDFTLLPLVVGDAAPAQVAEVLRHLWGGPETLVVISSDLSHYHEYGVAQAMDERTARAIESLHYDALNHDDACGRTPLSGLLYLLRERGGRIERLDLRNSGDTAGSRDQVVGYGAWACYED